MLGRIGRGLVACTVVLGFTGLALAGDRKVPSQYSTIQAAVDASAAGDVVLCAPGTYTEAVVATKSNITLSGYGCTWDGGTGTGAKHCVDITGDYVTVAGFDFKNGKDHCRVAGKYCKVKDCTSKDAGGSFCVLTGASAVVTYCEARTSAAAAVLVQGSSCALSYVDVYDCADVGIDVRGDTGGSVKYCHLERCNKGAVRCRGESHDRGDSCVVKYCEAYDCAEFAYNLAVNAVVCSSNYAETCGSSDTCGFDLDGDDGTCGGNTAWECRGHGFRCHGNRNWCHDNESDYCEGHGFRCEGDDNECDYHWSYGNGGDGHSCAGDRNWFYDCTAKYCGDDGFDVDSGADNLLKYCTSKYNDGAGCENGGTSTDVVGCVFLYNAVDIGLDATLGASFGTVTGNLIGSGSILLGLKIGLGL